jgi:lysophospholipase L1-like esterase
VLNRGIEGQESIDLLERFPRDVVALQPRSVMLWGFINDIHRAPRTDIDAVLARVRASYTSMIEQSRASGIDVILATEVTVTTPGSWSDRLMALAGQMLRKPSYQDFVNGHVRATNAWLRETARKERLLVLDLERVVSGPNGERRREFAAPDGTHLTAAAYDALSRYSRPILERHFRAEG